MNMPFKVAIIGLNTSHAVALPKLMQDLTTPEELRVPELLATRCLRFETPFQDEKGLNERQAYLESIGVRVTTDFDEAVADCDGIMLEINDPTRHLEYFKKCAMLGKPIFLDKPFADTCENMQKIVAVAKKHEVRFFTSSSLRFDEDFVAGLQRGLNAESAVVWGPVGKAAAGSSIIWYGCHAFEMLEAIMGTGASTVTASSDSRGYVFHVIYPDGRRGVVELCYDSGRYGAVIRSKTDECFIQVSERIPFYYKLLQKLVKFFHGEDVLELEDSMEVMRLIAAADHAAETDCNEPV